VAAAQGVSDDLLSIELPDITLDKRAIIINSLLGKVGLD
jgi:hypothetical protein